VCNAGLLDHPDALDLLWEMTRLSFERVHLAGELSRLAECSERVFRRFRGLHQVDAVWFGPDAERHDTAVGTSGAFDAIDGALQGMRDYAGAKTGIYALLRSVEDLPMYLERFAERSLIPQFRVMRGVDPSALAGVLHGIEDEDLQAQLGAQLPESLWQTPRATLRVAEPAWGPGVPLWTSQIDRDLAP